MDPPPARHFALLNDISRALASDDVPMFKNMCLAEGFRPGEIERYSVLELLQVMDRRRVIAPDKYTKLCQMLTDIGRGDLVRKFFSPESVPVSSSKKSHSGQEASHPHTQEPAPARSMNSVVTERDLSWLSSNMGRDWQQIGIRYLGMTDNDIFHCTADNSLSVTGQIFAMLIKWRCRNGNEATYCQLIKKLEQHQDFDRKILEELRHKATNSN